MQKKQKKLIFIIIVIAVLLFLIINLNKMLKTSKIGKNSSSQEIINYILNISSYESEIEVEVKSNKNTNKYIINQMYIKDYKSIQNIIEPKNIQGIKIIREKNNIKIENTRLSLVKVIENYKDIAQNKFDLENFIKDYNNNSNSKYRQENNEIIMETTGKTENIYQKYETLYINKQTAKPTKMEIKDTNKNVIIYIKYNKININEINKEKVYAFQIYNILKEI